MGKDASSFAELLWDVAQSLRPRRPSSKPAPTAHAKPVLSAARVRAPRATVRPAADFIAVAPPKRVSARQARYDELVAAMKRDHDVRVVRWRTRNSGCAWQVDYSDGTVARLIEAPYPRGPVSCAVFLHEVGHHAIGFYRYKPRCYEEYMAWKWSLAAMREWGLTITPRVEQVVDQALRYAVAKALRRGMKRLPAELAMYLPATHRIISPPPNPAPRRSA